MENAVWLPMSVAPRDGQDLVVKASGGNLYFFIRWGGESWMCGPIPMGAGGLTWRLAGDLAGNSEGRSAHEGS
ncbi:MAG: hypothetical protein INR70_29025 [Parafilimonas terrae]|nr:hypothetical protein [Parafilimonas terrae]